MSHSWKHREQSEASISAITGGKKEVKENKNKEQITLQLSSL